MVKYENGKIYTIRCKTDPTLIYVGSTVKKLCDRMAGHRFNSKQHKNLVLYQKVNGNWGDWYIELYESFPCNSKEELLKREGEVIRQIATLNKQIAGRTPTEYYQENKDKILEIKAEYYQENKDKILEKKAEYYLENKEKISEKKRERVICICGCESLKRHLARHQKSKKHIELMKNQPIT